MEKKQLYKYLGYGHPRVTGRFGIEVEAEGRKLPMGLPQGSPWVPTGDGSLRDGVEYLLAHPLDLDNAIKALFHLRDLFHENESELSFSFRTSVHVHLNCLSLERKEIGNLLYTLVLFEPLIVNMSGEERRHNRFCLTTLDAESQVDLIKKFIHQDEHYKGFPRMVQFLNEDEGKYSAINLVPLASKGSLEIRTMRGNMNITLLTYYLTLLSKIYDWAIVQDTPLSIYNKLQLAGGTALLAEILGDTPVGFFQYPELDAEIALQASVNISLCYKD